MLVLSRREGERVVIGDPERPIGIVQVVRMVRGEKVRLGFEGFHKDVPIHREEVVAGIKAEPGREGGA